eukprot:TRINITY_DN1677_c0_g1_i1.p1 TRINITY_DN1677_c0_g1~~TRINITY_DN1677_c0_g1_i1.p1  ORF type:complete len:214 (-),score=38.56 TRINITY_DN1677_c0_g1_i1:124-765(-)
MKLSIVYGILIFIFCNTWVRCFSLENINDDNFLECESLGLPFKCKLKPKFNFNQYILNVEGQLSNENFSFYLKDAITSNEKCIAHKICWKLVFRTKNPEALIFRIVGTFENEQFATKHLLWRISDSDDRKSNSFEDSFFNSRVVDPLDDPVENFTPLIIGGIVLFVSVTFLCVCMKRRKMAWEERQNEEPIISSTNPPQEIEQFPLNRKIVSP